MVVCAYCSKRSTRERTNHSFPLNDPTLLKVWLKNMKTVDGWTPTVNSRLCSDHFLNDCYKTNPGSSRRTLKKGSVPTVFVETKKKCAYCNLSKSEGRVKRSFHRFPLSAPKTLKKWLCNMDLKDWQPTEDSRLCSDHFEASCLRSHRGYLKLVDGSIPSIFPVESKKEDYSSISQPSAETNPVTEDTELDHRSLQQPMDIDQTEVSVIQLLYDHSDESLVTCPQCNHTFSPEGLSEELARQSTSAYGLIDREPAAISTISKFESPDVDEMKKSTAHDHSYETSPSALKKRLQSFTERNKKLRQGLKLEKKRCNRMKKRITLLLEEVGELKRNRI